MTSPEQEKPVLVWASGTVISGRQAGEVTARTWEPEVGSSDEYAVADAEDGIIAITTIYRPAVNEITIDVLGTDEGAVQAAWECEAEEAARKTGV